MATPAPTLTITPSPNPDSSSSSSVLHDLLSPGAIVGIAISIAITATILAILCCYCCCCRRRRHSSSQRSHGRQSPVSRPDSETPTSELGLAHEPASMLEMDASGRDVVLKEPPPPAYYTLEHANPRADPRRPPPVEMMGAETRRGAGPEAGPGMEAWNGGRAGGSSEVDPWTPHEVPATAPSPPAGGNMNLRVDTDAPRVIHVTGENGKEDEGADLSRSVTCSTYSIREAALGTVAMPSIVNKERNRNQGKS